MSLTFRSMTLVRKGLYITYISSFAWAVIRSRNIEFWSLSELILFLAVSSSFFSSTTSSLFSDVISCISLSTSNTSSCELVEATVKNAKWKGGILKRERKEGNNKLKIGWKLFVENELIESKIDPLPVPKRHLGVHSSSLRFITF